ncbi:MAG: hypothetical protein HRT45_14450 [Bdellovibrionales bacterium]|nr:hypothetical protein [Bdellovibrionales bacterium]
MLRVKNAISYVEGFGIGLVELSSWVVPGGKIVFMFDQDFQRQIVNRYHGPLLDQLRAEGWVESELTGYQLSGFEFVRPEN